MRTKCGQAMVEFVVGVFALVLIISAIIAFGRTIPEATRHLSLVRVKAGRNAQTASSGNSAGSAPSAVSGFLSEAGTTTEPGPFSEETLNFEVGLSDIGENGFLGISKLHMSESATIPLMTIPRPSRTQGGTW